jgi:(p)ppGpp synthase/HD superfamily hydrolase
MHERINEVEKARIFATAAHAAVDQRRKYTNAPYIVHPAEVASIVKSVGGTPDMIAAAWLHDVVEDTKVTNEIITQEFGSIIAGLVGWLTDISKPEYGNREFRKRMDREYIFNAPAEAQTVKLADLISNTKSIMQYDPNFAVIYLKEKRLLLEVLTKGDAILMAEAKRYIGVEK